MHRATPGIRALTMLAVLIAAGAATADQTLVSRQVLVEPRVDGSADDPAWVGAAAITTRDAVAGIDIRLQAVHTTDHVYFLVRYPDAEESRSHRSWSWDAEAGEYVGGPDREDVFVFKWLLTGDDRDFGVHAAAEHMADIWFWKAARTDPAGYADDKFQRLSSCRLERSREIASAGGGIMYLQRLGDSGKPAYRTDMVVDYAGPRLPRFTAEEPQGSRSDIRARGRWADGWWTIEFSRRLVTGNDDDVALHAGGRHVFGVSRYEISGRPEEPGSDQPRYGCGDVGERLVLELEKLPDGGS